MNTNFIDMTATLSNLAYQESTALPSAGVRDFKSGDQGFESRFQREVSRYASKGQSMVDGHHAQEKAVAALKQKLTDSAPEQGQGDGEGSLFVSKLEQALLKLSGGNLANLTMDGQGLDALKELLVKAGFDPSDVEEMIAGLKEKAKGAPISLDTVMSQVAKLEEGELDTEPEEVLLETSALPILSTLLAELGIPEEASADLVKAADRGQGGISLDVILKELKQIQNQLSASGQTVTVKEGDTSFQRLMAQLNMPMADQGSSTVSLDDLISAFETYKLKHQAESKLSAAQMTATNGIQAMVSRKDDIRTDTQAMIDRLFRSFSLKSESAGSAGPEFSFEQVKNQFANELLIPAKEKNGKKGLFAQAQAGTDPKLDATLKEIGAAVSKHMGDASDHTRQNRPESFAKELKSELRNGGDLFQGMSEAKNEIEGPAASLKARPAQRPMPAFVTQQVGRGIVRAMNQGENTLTLQLKPAALGRVQLTIDNLGSSIKVSIVTENQAARDALASNVNELKASLSSAGISLESFDVDMNSNFKQSMADAGNQAGQFGRKNKGQGNAAADSLDGETADPLDISQGGMAATDGSYHFVA